MKHTYFIRKIDELGRIVLPMEIRQMLNINQKDSLEISVQNNGIFIKKEQNRCELCNSTHNLLEFNGKNICNKCINSIKKMN